MEKQTIIPQDIQDDADRLWPSDIYHVQGSVRSIDANHSHRKAYIHGRIEERSRFKLDILDSINHIDAIDSLNQLSSQKQAHYINEAIEKLKMSLDNLKKLL